MDQIAFHEIHNHLFSFTLVDTKLGYFLGKPEDKMILVHGTRKIEDNDEGKWVVWYKKNISYVCPELYNLLQTYNQPYIEGQTLSDGTVMSINRALATDNNTSNTDKPKRKRSLLSNTKDIAIIGKINNKKQEHHIPKKRKMIDTVNIATTDSDREEKEKCFKEHEENWKAVEINYL